MAPKIRIAHTPKNIMSSEAQAKNNRNIVPQLPQNKDNIIEKLKKLSDAKTCVSEVKYAKSAINSVMRPFEARLPTAEEREIYAAARTALNDKYDSMSMDQLLRMRQKLIEILS